jgi:mannose-6-phosphate isomerase-like protein (cupin superfamily)
MFPGAVGVTDLRVYRWETPDGLRGGSPHVHLVCSEGYVVTEGSGAVQTITAAGYAETPLEPGDIVWFSPGTIHRLVNGDGHLRLTTVMQNDGLPEAGDAVLTYPAEHLADRAAYDAVTSLLGADGTPAQERARARRDLAIAGFGELRRAAERGDPAPLREFYVAANRLVEHRLDAWRTRWETTASRAAQRTGEQIEALTRGDHDHLRAAEIRSTRAAGGRTLGMCGFLRPYALR